MADVSLWGTDPRGHHLTSLLLHAASTVLLFVALDRATRSRGRSFVAAALFGLHPLHVESVAWVAERKDVLSGLFWMLALLAYLGYAARPSVRRMALVAALLAAGLAAKPMLVTLPGVLLLLDAWPLGRWSERGPKGLLLEKLPLVPLVVASAAITLVVQARGGAVSTLEDIPFHVRVLNAVVAYAAYLGKTIWPSDLAVFYPHPVAAPPAGTIAMAGGVLVAITVLAMRARGSRPYLLWGWLWFLGTLVPVIGIVQVGAQSMADRYMYVPSIGIFVMAVWGIADAVRSRRAVAVAAAAVLLALGGATWAQSSRWRDSETLYRHALDVEPDNPMVMILMGTTLAEDRQWEGALSWYERAAASRPNAALPRIRAAETLARLGRLDEAIARADEAIRLAPRQSESHAALGFALARAGRPTEAAARLEEALRLDPDDVAALTNLGSAQMMLGAADEGLRLYRRAIDLDPGYAEAHTKLGLALVQRGEIAASLPHLERAVALDANYAEARQNLALALALSGDTERAWRELAAARRLGLEPQASLLDLLRRAGPEPIE